jgi:hypothetical protein
MLKSALIAVAILAVAAPGLAAAKGKKAAAEQTADGPSAPIPYSQLAEEDAKLNGPAPKHHAAKKAAKKADADASTAGAAAPAK